MATTEAKIPEKVFNFQESRFWQKKSGRNKDILGSDFSDHVSDAHKDKITNRTAARGDSSIRRDHSRPAKQVKATSPGILPSGPEHPPRVTKKKVSPVHQDTPANDFGEQVPIAPMDKITNKSKVRSDSAIKRDHVRPAMRHRTTSHGILPTTDIECGDFGDEVPLSQRDKITNKNQVRSDSAIKREHVRPAKLIKNTSRGILPVTDIDAGDFGDEVPDSQRDKITNKSQVRSDSAIKREHVRPRRLIKTTSRGILPTTDIDAGDFGNEVSLAQRDKITNKSEVRSESAIKREHVRPPKLIKHQKSTGILPGIG